MSEQQDRLAKTINEAVDTLTKFVVPLYTIDKHKRPILFGTGFFLKASSDDFLITAGHVIDQSRQETLFFYHKPNELHAVTGRVITTASREERDGDPLDIGVVRLLDTRKPPYPEVGKFPMDISYLQPNRTPRTGTHYVIVGFPSSKAVLDSNKKQTFAPAYAYRSDSIVDQSYRNYGVNPESHVILPLDVKKGFDPAGRLVHFPKPNGMSGSPIIELYSESLQDKLRVFPVVAVGTRYKRKEKILIGTDVQCVVDVIERFYSH